MAADESKILTTDQIATTDIAPAMMTPPAGAAAPGVPANLPPGGSGEPTVTVPEAEPPPGTNPAVMPHDGVVPVDDKRGAGVEGEVEVWEARYSLKNFVGRLALVGALTVAWLALALYTWGGDNPRGRALEVLAVLLGIALGLVWLSLAWRILMARYGHFYRLTTRRLFVMTGVFNRRSDQLELLKVNDIYTQQSLVQRLLGVGTVVVESQEERYPITYLVGIDGPKGVMDLLWHHARAERDQKSVRVDQI